MLRMAYQSVNASANLDTNQRLSDLQVSNIMASVSSSCIDAVKSLQYCTFMRNKNRSRFVAAPELFWLRPRFQCWVSSKSSSLIMIKGAHASRFDVIDFCVNAISLLRDSKVPVLWALKTIDQDAVEAPSVVDLLKDLVSQALRVNDALHSERLPRVYILIHVEAVSPRLSSLDDTFSLPTAFLEFFQKRSNHGLQDRRQGGSCKLSMARRCLQTRQPKTYRILSSQSGDHRLSPMAVRSRMGSQRGSWSLRAGFRRGRGWGLAL